MSSKVHELGYYDTTLDKPLIRLTEAGTLDQAKVAELGQVVASQVSPRSMVVFRESQGGSSDAALAAWAYEQALACGLGREFQFG